MTAITLALVGIGVLQLPRHPLLTIAAAAMFVGALASALVNQAGI